MTTVIVPWRGGCPHRERAWAWVQQQYALRHPDWRVVEAPAPEGSWCKATAVTPAVEAAEGGIVVVVDADVWCESIDHAAKAVTSGLAKWAVPHFLVKRQSADGNGLDQEPYRGIEGGGIVVTTRDTYLDCPLDPRFVGWGQEDLSWGVALSVLHGRAWRGEADLVHLWHPPQPRMNRKHGSHAGMALQRRYLAARRDPALMRALIEEAR